MLKNGLIFDGSFNRAFMQAGATLYLFERGFKPDIVMGTSFGAINAIFIAADPSPKGVKRLLEFWNNIDTKIIFRKGILSKIKGDRHFDSKPILELLRRHIQWAPDTVEIPFLITTYDLDEENIKSWDNLNTLSLPHVILASISIPGLYKPVEIGGKEYVSGVVNLSSLYELAIERNVTSIHALESDNEKLLNKIDPRFRLYMKQNLIHTRELAIPEKSVQRYRIESNRAFEDFSSREEVMEEGYRQLRKQFIERKLMKLGRIKESLELLTRPDLTLEEEVMKAYTLYLEGDIWKAFEKFNNLSYKHAEVKENLHYITGYSRLLMDIGSLNEAEKILQEGKELYPKEPTIYDNLSRLAFFKGALRESIEYLNKAIALSQEKRDFITLNLAQNHKGVTLYMVGDFKRALGLVEESASRLRALDHAYYTVIAYNNLIKIYNDTGQLIQAENILKFLEEYVHISGSSRTMAIYLSSMASTIAYRNIKEAIRLEKEALEIALDKNDVSMIPLLLYSIAMKYIAIGEVEKAIKYLKEAMEISKEYNLAYPYQLSALQLIGAYIQANMRDEAEKLVLEIQSYKHLAPIMELQLKAIRIYLYEQKEQIQELIDTLKTIQDVRGVVYALPSQVRECLFEYMRDHTSVADLIRMGLKEVIVQKLSTKTKERIEFIETISPEDSLHFIDVIVNFADKFREDGYELKLKQITRYWYNNVEQFVKTFGHFTYFFNREMIPLERIGDLMNQYILQFLITNEGQRMTFGDISTTFGIHSESVRERLYHLQRIIEPWIITESPKYLIIHNDELIFTTDEHFQSDYKNFLENLRLFEETGRYTYLERAIEEYQEDFLLGVSHRYFEEIREMLREKYKAAVLELAKYYVDSENREKAIALLENFLLKYPNSPKHTKLLIELLYRENRRAAAYEWYLRFASLENTEPFDFYEITKEYGSKMEI